MRFSRISMFVVLSIFCFLLPEAKAQPSGVPVTLDSCSVNFPFSLKCCETYGTSGGFGPWDCFGWDGDGFVPDGGPILDLRMHPLRNCCYEKINEFIYTVVLANGLVPCRTKVTKEKGTVDYFSDGQEEWEFCWQIDGYVTARPPITIEEYLEVLYHYIMLQS